ncbi:MAG: hypothetical protein AAGF31_11625 [Planctomycetota bacterium]
MTVLLFLLGFAVLGITAFAIDEWYRRRDPRDYAPPFPEPQYKLLADTQPNDRVHFDERGRMIPYYSNYWQWDSRFSLVEVVMIITLGAVNIGLAKVLSPNDITVHILVMVGTVFWCACLHFRKLTPGNTKPPRGQLAARIIGWSLPTVILLAVCLFGTVIEIPAELKEAPLHPHDIPW